ncbi:MAG TPA: hypothetical protein VFC32_02710 [Pseudolabrys sp.]|nr:hypothetical protein [Pseudolabrys sp.]
MDTIPTPPISDKREIYIAAQLEIFEIRSREMAAQVNAGLITMADAADLLHSAAVWSGLLGSGPIKYLADQMIG